MVSILGQSYRHFEIVVVNDGGDPVDELVIALGEQKRITLLNQDESLGPAAARNRAVAAAKGEIIVYLDDDDIYLPHHLSTIADALSKPGAPPVAYTNVEHRIYAQRGGEWGEVHREILPGIEFRYAALLVKNFIALNCLGHLKSLFEDVGGFDSSYPFLEDWEMLLRLTKKGGAQYIDVVTAVYRHYQDRYHVNALSSEAVSVTKRIYDAHTGKTKNDLQKYRSDHLAGLANAIRLKNRKSVSPPVEEQLKEIGQKISAKKLREATAELEALVERLPHDGELLLLLAKLKRASGAPKESEQLLQRAKQCDPYLFGC